MANPIYENLGRRIKAVRRKRGFTQAQLSEEIECSTPYISYIEKAHKCVSLEMFVFIANALNVSADELLRDSLETAAPYGMKKIIQIYYSPKMAIYSIWKASSIS